MHVRIRKKFQLSMLKCFCLAGVPAYATVCDRAWNVYNLYAYIHWAIYTQGNEIFSDV
jgi:hypothetical protein